jgi:hypothetical protein
MTIIYNNTDLKHNWNEDINCKTVVPSDSSKYLVCLMVCANCKIAVEIFGSLDSESRINDYWYFYYHKSIYVSISGTTTEYSYFYEHFTKKNL